MPLLPETDADREIQAFRIGRRLTKFRRAAKYTQKDLAALLNTTHQTIARYEAGETLIPALVLRRMAELLNVSPDAFFTDE